MICPDCSGEKQIAGWGCPGFKLIILPCRLCNQTGEIDEDTQKRIERGKKVREARREQGLTLRSFCDKLNITPSEVSNYECGMPSEYEKILNEYWRDLLA